MVRRYSRRDALKLAAAFGVVVGASWIGACGDDALREAPGDPPFGEVPLEPRAARNAVVTEGRLRLGSLKSVPMSTQPLTVFEKLLVYSRLVAVDPRTATIHGDLASAIEVVDPLEVRFELRAGAFFHPDVDSLALPVSAVAVQRSFEEAATEGVSLFSEIIESVTVPDAENVVIRLRGPFAFLFELLAAHDASVRSESHYSGFREPIGSGLFVPSGQDSTGMCCWRIRFIMTGDHLRFSRSIRSTLAMNGRWIARSAHFSSMCVSIRMRRVLNWERSELMRGKFGGLHVR